MKPQRTPELVNISSSSDDSPTTASTPIKLMEVCALDTLDLSDVSIEPRIGSAEDELSTTMNRVDISDCSVSTFISEDSPRVVTCFIPEENKAANVSSSYEEPDTPPPPLTRAPVLQDVANSPRISGPKSKKGKRDVLNDLENVTSPSSGEENHLGVDFTSPTLNCDYGGRGVHFTSKRLRRNRRQPVLITREIPHCHSYVANRSRGALSQPAPDWCTYCNHGLHRRTTRVGHGRVVNN